MINRKMIKLIFTFCFILLIFNASIIHAKHHSNKIVRVGLLKKRQESLCPPEYQSSCWCDYININNVNDYNNNNKYDSTATSLGSSYPSSSIMIDCQYYKTNTDNIHTNHNSTTTKINNLLVDIPRISSTSGSSKFKYLSHISYIDLSRTGIREVPSDAFHGLTGLQTIVITYCDSLETIRMFAFRNLPNLKSLIISNNPMLIDLEPHALGSLKNLNYLSLSMNKLPIIDGYIFSSSSNIKIIDFIGNPIKRIKSHAFHGLRNVSDLLLSLKQNISPIEAIEGDSFISTAFVDQIFLEGIPAKVLHRNAFRGLSFCKNLHLTNTHIQEIEENAFHRANNIQKLSFMNSKIKIIHSNSFNGAFNLDTIDLRGNYLTRINKTTFGDLVMPNLDYLNEMNQQFTLQNDSIILLDNVNPSERYVKKILFDQNPIQCDCNLAWLLNKKMYSDSITFPEICAGPKGYDCLRISDLTVDSLPCNDHDSKNLNVKVPCEDLIFDINKDTDIYSLSVPKGKHKDEKDDENNNQNNEDYYNDENNYYDANNNYYDGNDQTTSSIPSSTITHHNTQTSAIDKTNSPSSSFSSDTIEYLANNNNHLFSKKMIQHHSTTTKSLRNPKSTTPFISKSTKPLSYSNNQIVDNNKSRNLNSNEDANNNKNNSSLSLYKNSGSCSYCFIKFNFLNNNYFFFSKCFYLLINLNLFVFITFIYYNL